MAANKDYYSILGVSRDADDSTIKRAYRKLAKKYHPDANPGDKKAEEKFKDVNEAYDVLSDPKKKKMYDQFGSAAFEEGFNPNAGGGPFTGSNWHFNNGNGYQEFHFNGNDVNMDDIFGNMFDGFFHNAGGRSGGRAQGGFSGFSGQNAGSSYGNAYGGQSAGPMKGSNVTHDITISFRDAAFGCDRQLRTNGADGQIHTVKVHIPAGIDEGQSIRLKGRGNPGIAGGAPGDLMLKVHIAPEKGFSRKGNDVYQEITIPFTTAVFGGDAIVNTLQGRVEVRIPAGTQSGSKLKIRGKGIQSMKNKSVYGDTYAVVRIDVPVTMSAEAREKLHEFEQAMKK